MTLFEIKCHMQSVKSTSLYGLCQHFKTREDVILPMLDYWKHKGCLKERPKTSACGVRCLQCSPEMMCWFEWVK
jgi:hypothetical protein